MEVSKNNYYKVRKTVIEMLRDRGNEISEKYEIPFDEFVIQYDNDEIDMVIELEDKITCPLCKGLNERDSAYCVRCGKKLD